MDARSHTPKNFLVCRHPLFDLQKWLQPWTTKPWPCFFFFSSLTPLSPLWASTSSTSPLSTAASPYHIHVCMLWAVSPSSLTRNSRRGHTNPAPTVQVTSGIHMVQLHDDDHHPAKRNGEVKLKPPWIVYGDWCLCSFGDFENLFFGRPFIRSFLPSWSKFCWMFVSSRGTKGQTPEIASLIDRST